MQSFQLLARLAPLPVLLLVFLLSACQMPLEEAVFVETTFQHQNPYRLAVSSLQFTPPQVTHTPDGSHSVTYQAPVTPQTALERWAVERFQLLGEPSGLRLELQVTEAALYETELPKEGGFIGFFTDEQDLRLDGRLALQLQIVNPSSQTLAQIWLESSRSTTLPESASLIDKERALHELVEAMIQAINEEADRQIPRYFAHYLR